MQTTNKHEILSIGHYWAFVILSPNPRLSAPALELGPGSWSSSLALELGPGTQARPWPSILAQDP